MATKKAVPTRAEEFFNTGAKLAAKIGIVNVTRRAIAEAHNVSDPLVGKHVGGKAELQAGIKKAMKRQGISEPSADVIEKKGASLRARKGAAAPAKKVAKKAAAAKKPVAAKRSTAGKKSSAASPSPVSRKKPATALPADPKKGAPSRKVVKKAPANKAKFGGVKVPPLPAIPGV